MKVQNEKAFQIIIIACLQFLLLTMLAMVFYEGGTRLDPTVADYSFFQNFFSDLGRLEAFSGKSNLVSVFLFVIAILGLSIGSFTFFSIQPSLFVKNTHYYRYFDYSVKAGKLASLLFLGVALAPSDIIPIIHDFFVVSGFTLIAFVSLSLGILNYKEGFMNKWYSLAFFVLVIELILYGSLFLFIPTITNTSHLIIRATTQKIIIYSLIGCFLIQSYGFRRIK
ncbi:MAG: hypothetical protein ACXAC2_23135 [Candidatus Kariarchaeaceae archaeon]